MKVCSPSTQKICIVLMFFISFIHFHLFFCFFIRKQGWRWNHTLNKLLLRILQSLQRLLRRLRENGFLPQFWTDKNKPVFCQTEKIQNECELAMPLRLGMQRMEPVTQNKWEISQRHTHAPLCLDSFKLIFCFLDVFFSFSGKSEHIKGRKYVTTASKQIWS